MIVEAAAIVGEKRRISQRFFPRENRKNDCRGVFSRLGSPSLPQKSPPPHCTSKGEKMRMRSGLALALSALGWALAYVSPQASAALSPIAPFYGEKFESFETKALGFYPTQPTAFDIFDGAGGMSGLTTGSIGVANLVSDTRGYEVTAKNGNFFAGTPIGALRIDLDEPTGAFGTWIANAGFLVIDPTATSAAGVAEFFANGVSLGTQPLSITVEKWIWHGWTSTTPFDAIEFRVGDVPQGAPYESVLIDALVASSSSSPMLVPEPASVALLVLCGKTLVGLRRRLI
jgi:hypothetical protein